MNKEALVILVSGMRGCGKTEKVRGLVRDKRRLLIVDTKGIDYNEGVVFHDLDKLVAFWTTCNLGRFRLIYKPDHGDADKLCQEIGTICKLAGVCGDMTLVVEELNILFDRKRPPAEFNKLIYAGRGPGIELIGVSQRPFGFGPQLASQAKEFYVFYNLVPDDVTFYRRCLGKEAAEAVQSLTQYQYLKWIYAHGPRSWTIEKDDLL